MAWYNWSQTAASNATADPSINWAEGQSPSSINDSARAMMAATAKYRDDIAGALITSGTSTAYTLTSNSIFDSATQMNGQMIAFSPHVTNSTGPVTLTVDSISGGPFYLRSAPGVDLPAGTIIAGTPYTALFNSTNQEFYLQGFFGNPYNIPLAAGLDYWGTTAPSSAFAFPAGQAISRTTYATLFAIMGTISHGMKTITTIRIKSGAAMAAVVRRMVAVNGPATLNRRSERQYVARLMRPLASNRVSNSCSMKSLDTLANQSTGGGGYGVCRCQMPVGSS
jgi:hypothetical protein